MKNIFFKLPLYINDKNSIESISITRQKYVQKVEAMISNGTYKYIDNFCLCGNTDTNKDICLSKKDRYGFGIEFLLCKQCSIVRTNKRFDEKSLSGFYANYYRKIYGDGLQSIEEEYSNQVLKGAMYLDLLKQYIDINCINNVIDIGCGVGGVLFPFLKEHKNVFGIDYDIDRLNYGKSKGINLLHAYNDKSIINKIKYDLVILSHVMEHFADPIKEMNDIFNMISNEGHILIIVPSPLFIGKSPRITSRFFQNVHLYNFNKYYLAKLFVAMGMEIIYLDDLCQCILKKPLNWRRNDIKYFNNKLLENRYNTVLEHFKTVVLYNDILKIGILKYFFRDNIIRVLEIFHIKSFIKKFIR